MPAVRKTLKQVMTLLDHPIAVGIFVVLTVAAVCLLVPLPA